MTTESVGFSFFSEYSKGRDHHACQDLVQEILEQWGYKEKTLKDGVEAAKKYGKRKDSGDPFDVVILKLTIKGGMGGDQAIKELIMIHPGVKAIIASGYAKTKEVDAAQELGAGKYIEKPYTLEKIGVAVKGELEK